MNIVPAEPDQMQTGPKTAKYNPAQVCTAYQYPSTV